MIEFRYQYFIFFIKADFVGILFAFPQSIQELPGSSLRFKGFRKSNKDLCMVLQRSASQPPST